jgi:hypothetical protein
MDFTVESAKSRMLAAKAGKNNKTPVFVASTNSSLRRKRTGSKELKERGG